MQKRLLSVGLLALLACSPTADRSPDHDISLNDVTSAQVQAALREHPVSPGLERGNWESRIENLATELPDHITGAERTNVLARAQQPPQIGEGCIGDGDPSIPDPHMFEQFGGECRYLTFRAGKGKIDAHLRCAQPDVDVTGAGTYTGTEFSVEMTAKVLSGRFSGTNIRARTSGRKLGRCAG